MKKLSLIIVMLLLCSMVFGTDNVSHRQCSNPRRLRPLLQEMRDEFNGDTMLFDLGGTFDNATNNIFEWNENSEGILWTFASNLVTMSSDSSAVFSFGTLIPNLDGVDVDSYVYFNPISAAPATTEGFMYYDSDDNAVLFYNGSGWVTLAAGTGDNTLDNAYDEATQGAGKKIDADSGAVEIEVDAQSNNGALHLDNDDTNNLSVLLIESVGASTSTIAIDVDGQSTGRDFEGTGAACTIEGDGSIIGLDLDVTGASGITLENDATITNSTDGRFTFTEGGEDFDILLNSNKMTLYTGSLIDSLAFGVIDDLEGIGSIAFDAAASSITLPTNNDAHDFTIQTTGATNSSIVIQSVGTAADAMVLTTTAGGMDLTNDGAAGGEDLDISSSASSVNITAAEDVEDAIVVNASAGGINITADGAAAKDLDLTCTNGSVNITGGESNIDSVKVAATGGVNIDAADDIDIQVTSGAGGEDLLLTQVGGNDSSITLTAAGTGADAIGLQASAGGLDVDAVDDIIITVASTTTADDLALNQTGAQDAGILLTAAGTGADAILLNATAGGVDINAKDDCIITVASTTTADDLALVQTGAQDAGITLAAAGTGDDAIDVAASAGGVDIDSVKSVTITSTEDEDDAMVINTSAGGLQITSGGVEAAEDLEITSGASLQLISTETGVADGILVQALNESRIDVQGPVNLNSTLCLFEDQPIFAKYGKDAAPVWGGACTGATGDENMMMFPTASFIYHILGAVQTELGPQMRAGGFDISMDDTVDEGVEITPNILGRGATGGSRQAFIIDTDAFYLKVKIYITDTDGTDDLCVGFRKVEAFNAVNSYSDYAVLRNNAGDIYIESDLNGAAAASNDTTDDWADTTAVTLGVFVDVTGAVTYTIDGTAPSSTQAFTFDTTDVVVPFLYFLHHTNAAELTYLQEWECGLQY